MARGGTSFALLLLALIIHYLLCWWFRNAAGDQASWSTRRVLQRTMLLSALLRWPRL